MSRRHGQLNTKMAQGKVPIIVPSLKRGTDPEFTKTDPRGDCLGVKCVSAPPLGYRARNSCATHIEPKRLNAGRPKRVSNRCTWLHARCLITLRKSGFNSSCMANKRSRIRVFWSQTKPPCMLRWRGWRFSLASAKGNGSCGVSRTHVWRRKP